MAETTTVVSVEDEEFEEVVLNSEEPVVDRFLGTLVGRGGGWSAL